MISLLKQYFYNPLCFKCGSVFVERHLFCNICFEKHIVPRAEIKRRVIIDDGKVFNHFYIFDWAPGESDLLSRMVYQLKSDRCVLALRYYARILTAQLSDQEFQSEKPGLVLPLPGSKKSSNHAEKFADQIAKNLKLPMKDLFIKNPIEISQKKKSLIQRQTIAIELKYPTGSEQITTLRKDKPNIIYVDDILTTGNTFKVSRKALGIDQPGCIMTLFYRPTAQPGSLT